MTAHQCDVHLAVWVRVKAELGLSQRRLPSEKAEVARLKGKVLEVALKECRIIGTERTHGQESGVWKPGVLSVRWSRIGAGYRRSWRSSTDDEDLFGEI